MQVNDESTFIVTEEISDLGDQNRSNFEYESEILDAEYAPLYREKLINAIKKDYSTYLIISQPPTYYMRNNLAYELSVFLAGKNQPNFIISKALTPKDQRKWLEAFSSYFDRDTVKLEQELEKKQEDNVPTLSNIVSAFIAKVHAPTLTIPNITFFSANIKNLPQELQTKLILNLQKEVDNQVKLLNKMNEEINALKRNF